MSDPASTPDPSATPDPAAATEDLFLEQLDGDQALRLVRQLAHLAVDAQHVYDPIGHHAADCLAADLAGITAVARETAASGHPAVLDAGLDRSRDLYPRD